jgi:hypothetical protein
MLFDVIIRIYETDIKYYPYKRKFDIYYLNTFEDINLPQHREEFMMPEVGEV